jgi:hypothetical protein
VSERAHYRRVAIDPEGWRENATHYCVICGAPGGDPVRLVNGMPVPQREPTETRAHPECVARVQARRRRGRA